MLFRIKLLPILFVATAITLFSCKKEEFSSGGSSNISFSSVHKGVYEGHYDNDRYFRVELADNDVARVAANNQESPLLAQGTWMQLADKIQVDYTYEGEGQGLVYSLVGEMTNTDGQIIFSGEWYNGHGAEAGTEGGVFTMTKDSD